jgi:hypothetical protein
MRKCCSERPPPNQSSVLISLYGTNFGPAPGSVAICATPVDPCSSSSISVQSIPYWSDNQVNVFVNTSSTTSGTYYVQLTSGGESSGLGFVAAPGGESSALSNFATVQVALAVSGLTTISYNGSIIASSAPGTSCSELVCAVVVGQQITLTGYPVGGLWTIGGTTYNQWSPNGNPADPVMPTSNPVSFFWATGSGNNSFTVSYTANGATASAAFSVAAPTFTFGTINAVPPSTTNPNYPGQLVSTISISAPVTPPTSYTGTVSWLQVLPSQSGLIAGAGHSTLPCAYPGTSPWLDVAYPYPNVINGVFGDAPAMTVSSLPSGYVSAFRLGTFETYLLWQPTISGGSSFAVPLYLFNWQMNAWATYAGGAWTASGTTTYQPVSVAATPPAYPLWASILPARTPLTCQTP